MGEIEGFEDVDDMPCSEFYDKVESGDLISKTINFNALPTTDSVYPIDDSLNNSDVIKACLNREPLQSPGDRI